MPDRLRAVATGRGLPGRVREVPADLPAQLPRVTSGTRVPAGASKPWKQ
ncbi:hypothetical protein ABTX85_30925 [Streptomyces sp. NPDC096097]